MPWHDDDEDVDDEPPRPLLPPEDRIWRHPSELFGVGARDSLPDEVHGDRSRRLSPFVAVSFAMATLTAGALVIVAGLHGLADTGDAARDVQAAPSATSSIDVTSEPVFRIRVRRGDEWVNGNATVFRRDGVLVTTRRLILDAEEVSVDLGQLGERQARVVGSDAHTDLAVLTVEIPDLRRSAQWSDEALMGPASIAGFVGRGERETMRCTIIGTAVRERVPSGPAVDGMLRLDADIPVEMTGGPLLDDRGRVVGLVNSMPFEDDDMHDGSQAIAAPIASVVAETLIGDGRPRHAWLGIDVVDTEVEDAAGSSRAGVTVEGLAADSPAANAGVEVGDVVLGIGGSRVSSTSDLLTALRHRRIGDTIPVDLFRDGAERQVEVTLGASEDDG